MTALKCSEGNYFYNGGWMEWIDHPEVWDGMADEGWKLHVGGTVDNAQRILDAASAVFRHRRIHHKYLPKTEDFARQTGEQAGKWCAAYPGSVIEAFLAVHAVDEAVRRIDPTWNHDNATTRVPYEKKVGGTVVYTRYGAYRLDAMQGPNGPIADNRFQVKPGHIRDPWFNYNSMAGSYNGVAPLYYFEPFPRYTPEQTAALNRFSRGRG